MHNLKEEICIILLNVTLVRICRYLYPIEQTSFSDHRHVGRTQAQLVRPSRKRVTFYNKHFRYFRDIYVFYIIL